MADSLAYMLGYKTALSRHKLKHSVACKPVGYIGGRGCVSQTGKKYVFIDIRYKRTEMYTRTYKHESPVITGSVHNNSSGGL